MLVIRFMHGALSGDVLVHIYLINRSNVHIHTPMQNMLIYFEKTAQALQRTVCKSRMLNLDSRKARITMMLMLHI